MAQKNCWEAIRCGREPGGDNCTVLGVCPAATETRLNGINGGKNGGRVCWTVPATQISWGSTATGEPKAFGCLNCSFLRRIQKEEGPQFSFLEKAASRLDLGGQYGATRPTSKHSPPAVSGDSSPSTSPSHRP